MYKKLWGIIVLYGTHALKAASFILLLPHFTSIFIQSQWGVILAVQSFAFWLQIIVEYGFSMSATRDLARFSGDSQRELDIVSGVTGAKLLLSIVVLLLAIVAVIFVDIFRLNLEIVLLAVIASIMQGFNPLWYFVGINRISKYATVDFVSRLINLLLSFYIISQPSHSTRIFIINASTSFISVMIGYYFIVKRTGYPKFNLNLVLDALKQGFAIFTFLGVTSIYTTLNIFILGIFRDPLLVAAYGSADKLVRAAGGGLEPLNRVVYARLSRDYSLNPIAAKKTLFKFSVILILFGAIITMVGYFAAPLISKVLVPKYDILGYVRLLIFYIPILVLNNIFGLYIMLPLGYDKEFNFIFMFVSIMSFILMFIFVPTYGGIGMGYIVILAELCVSMMMGVFILKNKVLSNDLLSKRSIRYDR